MTKRDLKKELKGIYQAQAQAPVLVEVPRLQGLMIDGAGDPNNAPDFQAAVGALYGAAYTIKFGLKKTEGLDFGVMPLEGLWWAEDMAAFSLSRKDQWLWTLLIVVPEFVTADHLDQAKAELKRKKTDSPALNRVRLAGLEEGLSAQVLHVGPFDQEGPTIAALHDFIARQGYRLHGKHHEIYLSDPRKVAPEKWKTIIRQPCR